MDLLMRSAAMVAVWHRMTDEQRAELEEWERENIGYPNGLGTGDWPGWASLGVQPLDEMRFKPDSRNQALLAFATDADRDAFRAEIIALDASRRPQRHPGLRRGMPTPTGTPSAVYRFYDEAGRLLYVGVSDNWTKRLRQHRMRDWFVAVRRVEIAAYGSRREALDAEADAIAREDPIHNIAGKP